MYMSQNNYYICKRVCVIGNMGVGKMSLINRLTYGEFLKEPESTIGAGYCQLTESSKNVQVYNNLPIIQEEEVEYIRLNPNEPIRQISI